MKGFGGVSRRNMLIGGVAAPFIGVAGTGPVRAAAPMLGGAMAPFHRFALGGFEVTTLLAGTRTVDNPHGIFGMNVSDEAFDEAAQAAFIPSDQAQFFFTPTLVNTGAELVLFDTGMAPGGITAALAAAGYTPDQIDVVVLTHMHGDHIGGLMQDGVVTFANARYVTGAVEHNHWSNAGNDGFEGKVRPLSAQMQMIDPGQSVASGITAMFAPGHTPGHMIYMLESDGAQLALVADTANHYVWSLAYPDWEVRFDADKAQAAASRRQVFGMLAADRVPFIGYHMPFPALGYVEAIGDGFRYVPASYQMMLGKA